MDMVGPQDGGFGFDHIPADAGNARFLIFRMNTLFHNVPFSLRKISEPLRRGTPRERRLTVYGIKCL